MWSLVASVAQLGLAGLDRGSPLFTAALAVAYPLMLPAIAVLHVRHRAVRESGAVLATVTGVASVVLGAAAIVEPRLLPALLFVLGMWWWTMGKMWVETAVLPRPFGFATMALAVAAMVAAVALPLGPNAVIAVWLVPLAAALARRDVPSR